MVQPVGSAPDANRLPKPPAPVVTGPGLKQRSVLSARYRDCLLGDIPTLLLLILQAPVIGWLCTLVWGSVEKDTPSLYFVMCLSSIWFGCIGACREVVKERAIIERERFFGVSPWAVVTSKAQVLAVVGVAQSVLLQGAVEWKLALHGPMGVQLCALILCSWCGIGLGLVVSSMAASQERAVGAVPLLLLPQVLFSEIALPREYFSDVVAVVEKVMPVRWGYRIFVELAAQEIQWLPVAGAFTVMVLYAAFLVVIAGALLIPRREL